MKYVELLGYYIVLTSSIYMGTQTAFAKRLLDICGGLFGCLITGKQF